MPDKHVPIGARGIGRMITEGFVTNGAKVYISSRDAAACEKAAEELNALGEWPSLANLTLRYFRERSTV